MRPSKLFSKVAMGVVGSGDTRLPLIKSKKRPLKSLTKRELIQLESEVGRTLFGEPPEGTTRREFFNLDPKTWIWHEEWRDKHGKEHQITTRYEIQEDSVIKVQPGLRYQKVEGQELENLRVAVELYHEQVMRKIYKRDPRTGDKLL